MTEQKNAAQAADPIKIRPHDITQHLRTPEEMAEYLIACAEFEAQDAGLMRKAVHDVVAAALKLRAPVADERAACTDPLSDFQEGQWWVKELDALAQAPGATHDQKRAVAVVHHMLRSAALASTPVSGEAPSDMPTPIWWINHGLHGQVTLRHDEADRARLNGAAVYQYHAAPQASAADVAAIVAFVFARFGQPGDAGELPDNVVAAVRRLEVSTQASRAAQVDFADAYLGAREDQAIWKRRALEAERDLRTERETSSRLAEAIVKTHESMFAQCCSNPVRNAWGAEVNLLPLNQAYELARAALSAQPAKEPANPEPAPASNPGHAGIPSDPLTGKNNDGGAVYG